MTLARTVPPTVEQFDHELAKLSIEGYWNTIGVSPPEPKPRADAHLWHWKDIYENLFKASEVVNLEDGAERRSLRLCTPGLPWRSTTETIQASVQMVLPGEVARAHRHSAAALRFVIEGSTGYTTVDGERMCCNRAISCSLRREPGTTTEIFRAIPSFGSTCSISHSCARSMALFFEAFDDRSQAIVRPEGHGRRMTGPARPAGTHSPRAGVPFHYSAAESHAVLREIPVAEANYATARRLNSSIRSTAARHCQPCNAACIASSLGRSLAAIATPGTPWCTSSQGADGPWPAKRQWPGDRTIRFPFHRGLGISTRCPTAKRSSSRSQTSQSSEHSHSTASKSGRPSPPIQRKSSSSRNGEEHEFSTSAISSNRNQRGGASWRCRASQSLRAIPLGRSELSSVPRQAI